MFINEQVMKKKILSNIELLEQHLSKLFKYDFLHEYNVKNLNFKFVKDEVDTSNGRCDLLFLHKEEIVIDDTIARNLFFVIVELKNRVSNCEDLGQLTRYINGLKMQLDNFGDVKFEAESYEVKGVLLSYGLNDNLKQIELSDLLQDIKFMDIETSLSFNTLSYSYNEYFTRKAKLDKSVVKFIENKTNE